MINKFDEMRAAVAEAEILMRAADSVSCQMARMLVGRLRKVESTYVLEQLKRELRQFNIHTGRWSDK